MRKDLKIGLNVQVEEDVLLGNNISLGDNVTTSKN